MVGSLSDAQIELYSRQILLPELGGMGQKRLLAARCLLVGADTAAAVAATYLVGAGIGRLHRIAASAADATSEMLPPLVARSPDTRITDLPGLLEEPYEYDALVLTGAADALPTLPHGRPRLGEVRVGFESEGTVGLVVHPASAPGCILCSVVTGARASERIGAQVDTVAAALAGALAALAVCRWIGGFASPEATAFRLTAEAPTWEPATLRRRRPCPRGCCP